MKKGKILLGLAGIISIIVIIVIMSYLSKTEFVLIQPETLEDCASISGNFIKDACYMQIAAKEADETICNKILSDNQKDLCFIELSKIKRDKSICELIIDKKYSKTKCYGEMNILLNY